MRKYFGTDGIRRITNTELTPELVYKVAKAGACVLSKHTNHTPTILIGRDTRISGTLIESAMTAGFLSYGANVKLLGVIPTPGVAYLTKKYNADASVVISASHNTYEFNGIKFFSNKGMKISDDIEEKIEEIMDSGKISKLNAVPHKIGISEVKSDMSDTYINFVINNFENIDQMCNSRKDFIVGIDTANGATYKIAEKIFKSLKIPYKIINNNPDGTNINKNCGSTHIENIKKFVLDNKLSLGIAYDGDGDRCLAVDEKGNLIDGDKLLAIFAKYLKKKEKLNKDTLVATVMSNLGMNRFADDNNVNLVQTNVGDRYVLEKMLENGYNLGGEQSGHIIMLDYNPTGDGIFTSLMLIKIMLEENVSASNLSKIIKTYPQVLINAKVNQKRKMEYEENKQIKQAIDELKDKFKNNGRVLIRPSGTEPLIRVMIEGEDQSYISAEAKKLADLIEKNLN